MHKVKQTVKAFKNDRDLQLSSTYIHGYKQAKKPPHFCAETTIYDRASESTTELNATSDNT